MKLTPTQRYVLEELREGDIAVQRYGSVLFNGGHRLCNLSTIKVLERHGLVMNINRWQWVITEEGLKQDSAIK